MGKRPIPVVDFNCAAALGRRVFLKRGISHNQRTAVLAGSSVKEYACASNAFLIGNADALKLNRAALKIRGGEGNQ